MVGPTSPVVATTPKKIAEARCLVLVHFLRTSKAWTVLGVVQMCEFFKLFQSGIILYLVPVFTF